MNLVLEVEAPPFREDATGAIRVGNSRVLLELVIRAFQDGASPESIVQRYSTVSWSDVYSAIGYYLRHQEAVEAYLNYREQLADAAAAVYHYNFTRFSTQKAKPILKNICKDYGYPKLFVTRDTSLSLLSRSILI